MRGAVLEKEMPRVAARLHVARQRGVLAFARIAALLERQSELELSDDQMKIQQVDVRLDR